MRHAILGNIGKVPHVPANPEKQNEGSAVFVGDTGTTSAKNGWILKACLLFGFSHDGCFGFAVGELMNRS